jgi:hypothetical protein
MGAALATAMNAATKRAVNELRSVRVIWDSNRFRRFRSARVAVAADNGIVGGRHCRPAANR